jgi:RNA polymerase sigma factor (TIGR02999 family)
MFQRDGVGAFRRRQYMFMDELKDLLQKAHEGDEAARIRLFAVAYEELRSLAHAQLRRGGPNTLLNTTVLIHESFLRFRSAGQLTGTERGHFFSYAARIMRSVIVDFARQRQAERRGRDAVHVPLSMQLAENLSTGEDEVVKINDALDTLQKLDERLVQVVEMRYFAGMTEPEIADVLGISERTVRRDWEKARLLLMSSLR